MKRFDALHCPLEGNHLIESSAGTGKTYTISSLYLRLLLERKLAPGRILVVTFTEAATQDLNQRIRERIVEAMEAFELGGSKDEFLLALVREFPGTREVARRMLELALRSFDEAAIFTIHGFCQRVLQENAFESGSRFDTQLLTDQQDLMEEILADFWRMKFPASSSTFFDFARQRGLSLAELSRLSRMLVRHPQLRILPDETGYASQEEIRGEEQFLSCFQTVGKQWNEEKVSIRQLLENSPALKRTTHKLETLAGIFQKLEVYFSSTPLLPEGFEKITSAGVREGTKANQLPPDHPFFAAMESLEDAAESLRRCYEKKWIELHKELALFLDQELKKRKIRQNLRGYEDLLLDFEAALTGSAGARLIQVVSERYPAALIDEFQDTDPTQYHIFRTLYDGTRGALFLIGDPKQAIYSFRGADVFTYLEAFRKTASRHTLDRNWRSSSRLIQAVNTLFSADRHPFVFPEIQFLKVEAGREEASRGLLWDEIPDPAPLKLWMVQREEGTAKPLAKGEADGRIPAAVAGEVARLLDAGRKGSALVEGRSLSARDIAVLVPTNSKARLIHEALAKERIPSVVYGTESVFASEEAEDLRWILLAISDPAREGCLKAALVTRTIGLDGHQLLEELSSESRWESILEEFSDYREQWFRHGFMPMARRLLSRRKVRQNLLRLPEGERRLTNLLHCLELIQQAVSQEHLGLDGVLKWLVARKTEEESIPPEEYQIRLETDEAAVQVITVHRSKGLEYPVVFCPYPWYLKKPTTTPEILCHNPDMPEQMLLDLRSDEWLEIAGEREKEDRQQKEQSFLREQLAENARLLYVSLTRAKYRCYLVWGCLADAGRTALAYLLHPAGTGEDEWPLSSHPKLETMSDRQIQEDLTGLVKRSEGAIVVEPLPSPLLKTREIPPNELQLLPSREFHGSLASDWGIASFTSLVSRRVEDAELPDRDAIGTVPRPHLPPASPIPGKSSLVHFPGGVRAGNFFHALFEKLDFNQVDSRETEDLVEISLREYGYEPEWKETILGLLRRVLILPLEAGNERIRLGDLSPAQRRPEVEFTLPLERLTAERLCRLFEKEDMPGFGGTLPETLEQLAFRPVRGLLHGYIDLIFEAGGRYYLLDWKSNFLGPEPAYYLPQALRETIRREFYFLQYSLYCVALHRHLESRLPGYNCERDFGGVFYLFLRGIDLSAENGCGVYFDRPSGRSIRALSELLGES